MLNRRHQLSLASVFTAAYAGMLASPFASAATPGTKQVDIGTGWGLPFHGEGAADGNSIGFPVQDQRSGVVALTSFDPNWGTLHGSASGGVVIHNINYTWDMVNTTATGSATGDGTFGTQTVSAGDSGETSGGGNSTD